MYSYNIVWCCCSSAVAVTFSSHIKIKYTQLYYYYYNNTVQPRRLFVILAQRTAPRSSSPPPPPPPIASHLPLLLLAGLAD